jgi:hypothetical protein
MDVPPFSGNVSFNAHHSPMGAFFSFTCGHFGTRGGMAAQLGRPANQDIYIGVKDGGRHSNSPLRCLPFYEGADKGEQAQVPEVAQQAAASYLVEQQANPDLADPDADKKKPKVTAYGKAQIRRHYGWGIDRWVTPDFGFEICTPFGPIADPAVSSATEMRRTLLPAVIAELRVDNTAGKQTKTAFFALGFHEAGVRILDEGLGAGQSKRLGFALRNQLGVAGQLFDTRDNAYSPPAHEPFVFMRWSPNEGLAEEHNPVHLLGSCPGIGFEVPAGKCYSLVIALGCYLDGAVTTRLEGRYLYTRYFAGLQDVLAEALMNGYECWKLANQRDQELLASGLSADQQFLIAHATRSYYGSTELLDVGGRPYWIVNEGEYVMMNTLDLSVDQVFWELKWNPWVVRNLLDNFVRFYSYHDQCGLSFCHDQGIHGQFSPLGHSSYELTDLKGCFSHMTAEQLCNWTLIAACYVAKTRDTAWLSRTKPIIDACLGSMLNRDDADPAKRNGIMGTDSSRCGSGQEITTYDSLDHSLAQSRNNLYLAVKGWATYEGLCYLETALGDKARAAEADRACRKAADSVARQLGPDGVIPAVFEKDNPGYHSRILPAIEGLVYPLYWAGCDPDGYGRYVREQVLNEESDSAHGRLLRALRSHAQSLLGDPENRNRFPDGGWKLSSTANNSWMSKIAIAQHVVREVFGLEKGDARQRAADAAHVKWQTEGSSAYWACSDQMVKGVAWGSKYYPRIVTTILWMESRA